MRTVAIMIGGVCALLSSLAVVGSGSSARAADLSAYFKEIVGTSAPSPADIGTKNVLQLNTTMFELYGDAAQVTFLRFSGHWIKRLGALPVRG